MTSAEIRRSFLDFFREKEHAIVPSSSLLPDAPNLLFTNAGMNQFVPIFLGQAPCPYTPARAADTQKCIRAGGKHNDLEDVGFDTYHHTFFEMLGNWSFGDYFKQEAIAWAWELVAGRWNFPASRIYATVYQPGPGDPASFDQEAHDEWAKIFRAAGIDPAIHIVNGNKKDNFWMMGDTGPCGPCSELHIDLTPGPRDLDAARQRAGRELVNQGDARCIEIWNLVFIQFNANPDGSFVDLPAKHVDTGMGFERVCSMIQGTKNLTDFSKDAKISNYETDVFRPLFDELEKLSGKKYESTLPVNAQNLSEQEKIDVAFRVIADHIRTLSFSIADGIRPSNEGRGYVLRRILRRAVRYGRNLGLREPFLAKLVPVLGATMGEIFPEVVKQAATIQTTLTQEEESFFRTLERGIELFDSVILSLSKDQLGKNVRNFPGTEAFKLYDTYGFPLDLTELMARELGMSIDVAEFDRLMDVQKQRSRDASHADQLTVRKDEGRTTFTYDYDEVRTTIIGAYGQGLSGIVPDKTPFYVAMGGQVADLGTATIGEQTFRVKHVEKALTSICHDLDIEGLFNIAGVLGRECILNIDSVHRAKVSAHHSATHILHWALRQVLGATIGQKGSYVGPDRLRFDFSHGTAMTPAQIAEVEALVNGRIAEDVPVAWDERPYAKVKGDPSILQFFGDKYGETVRVVTIGNFSRELCGGTHVKQTAQIGYFKILSEGAIAAGIRRIEAASGVALAEIMRERILGQEEQYALLRHRKSDLPPNLTEAISATKEFRNFAIARLSNDLTADVLSKYWAARDHALKASTEVVITHEKEQAKAAEADFQRRAAAEAAELIGRAQMLGDIPFLAQVIPDAPAAYLPVLADALKARWQGVALLASTDAGKVALLCAVAPAFAKKVQAGKIIQAIAPLVGGKGGGRPELAQGGGTNPEGIAAAWTKAEQLVRSVV